MMQAQLQLPFAPAGGGLFHPSQLRSQVITQAIAKSDIGAVAVEILDFATHADIFLAIDEYLVVQREVDDILTQCLRIERYVQEKIVAIAGPEILAFHPTLLVPQPMCKKEASSHLARKKRFLVDPALGKVVGLLAKLAGGDIAIAKGK